MTAKPPPIPTKSNGLAAAIVGIAFIFAAAALIELRTWRPTNIGHALMLAVLILIILGSALIRARRRISTANILLLVASCVIGLAVAEVALAVVGIPPLKRIVWTAPDLVPWWGANATGQVRFIPEKYDGPWIINPQGFPDTDDFAKPPAAPRRILLLGDSFAYGASASAESKSFAELLDAALPQTVWNYAIPGTGQQEQLELLTGAPADAEVVVATLYRNDFADNLLPPWRFYVFADGSWVDRFERLDTGGFTELTPLQAYRRAFGVQNFRDVLKASRTASAIAGLVHKLDSPHSLFIPKPTPGYDQTKALVAQLQKTAVARHARFVLVLIPDRDDLAVPSDVYMDSLRLCDELGIPCIDLRQDLQEFDYAPLPDTHWNDSGHAKVAARLQRELDQKTDETVSREKGADDPIR